MVQPMEEDPRDKFPFEGLVEDAKIILRGGKFIVQHVLKKGNLCADTLAKLRAEQPIS
ncbi:unnamed protein product [Camellia sinensis]